MTSCNCKASSDAALARGIPVGILATVMRETASFDEQRLLRRTTTRRVTDMAKKAARAKMRRLGRTSIRLIGNPVSSYIDAHGDDPPYHDQHSDGGTYYDHPDNEHNDFHHDEAGKVTNYRGDPVELVSEAISRLETMLTKFEVVQRQRLQ